jgi:glycosyltransferase involved in cell wall biosynthesis
MHPSAGGPPVVIEKLCLLAPCEGWDASVITTSLYCDDDGKKLEKAMRQHIDLKVLPLRGPSILKHPSRATEAIDQAVALADIVHLHTLWHPMNAIARRACERLGRKYVLMPHGMLDPYSLRQKGWRKRLYLTAIERGNLKRANRLVFTTAEEERCAREAFPWLPPGAVIPLGADGPCDLPRNVAAEAFRRLFPQVEGRLCVLFLGRIHRKKGLEGLLAALPEIARKHPKVLLVVAGEGERSYVQHLRKLVRTANLDDHTLFTGLLAGEAKLGAFASAVSFVLPSSQENFAISVAEAMHMAVPVIVSDRVNSWPSVVEAGAGFVVAEAQMESELARRIDELLEAPDRARALGARGQAFARTRFTWPRVARDMTSLYRHVLSE